MKYALLVKMSFAVALCLAVRQSAPAQGCNRWMTPQYSQYTSTSNDATHVYTAVTTDGTTTGTCPLGCSCNAYHTPGAYNELNGSGGWGYGPQQAWNYWIVGTNNQSTLATPGNTYPWSYEGEVLCSLVGTFWYDTLTNTDVAQFTPIQHNYPNNPLPNPCRISQFFDAVNNSHAHHAEDVVYDNGNGGGTVPAYGAPVSAMEGGTVVAAVSGNGPASQPYPQCVGTGAPGNYVKIKGSDGYYTVYFHVSPTVSVNQQVSAGQQIGVLDNSGCQSAAHLHAARKDPNGNPVNFTIPCVNQIPTTNFADGLVGDDVPDNL